MCPTGLWIVIILLITQLNESFQTSIKSTIIEEVADINGSIIISFDFKKKCEPGEYLEVDDECYTCKAYNETCSLSKECCGIKYMTCNSKCECANDYEWNEETSECEFTNLSDLEIIIILIGTLVVLPICIYFCSLLCGKGLKRIRERREANCPLPTIILVNHVTDENFPDRFTSLPRSSAPAFLSALSEADYPEPDAEVAYPPPAYIIPPEAWAFDKPPDYEDLSPVAVSPPPRYDQAIPEGPFVFPSSQVAPS